MSIEFDDLVSIFVCVCVCMYVCIISMCACYDDFALEFSNVKLFNRIVFTSVVKFAHVSTS